MMSQPDDQYSKNRLVLTFVGFFLYVGDIVTDTILAVNYFKEAQYVWGGMTLMFVLTGLLVTQIFSCAWFRDDMETEGEQENCSSKAKSVAIHVFGIGIFFRYCRLLREGFKEIWMTNSPKQGHYRLFCMAADLSMLKMFEAFLESVPQLLLQLHILQENNELSVMQCLSMAFSFFNVALAVVDYRGLLRRSLPKTNKMPPGLPTAVYLLYKLGTITSLVFSYSLLLRVSIYSTVGFALLWVVTTSWAHLCETDFCSSRALELLYRAVVGVILMFTFFNVKGQDTKNSMSTYYVLYTVINISAPIVFIYCKLTISMFFMIALVIIFAGSLLGLLCLVLYYHYLHPRTQADEVDGQQKEVLPNRRSKFLQL
ncbi:XK-related protein 9 [Cololabis saira]|uniref:XK-related protein 9 n=1 Tax=Cololabis saira TaxID=129043 RepID=UPI002AD4D4E7|nr:XK-related protein 9 [Cololabis saira]